MDAYHPGSLAVQERVGVRDLADHVGRSVGPGIRPVAAAFLEAQPMLVIGAADAAGHVWASLLTGAPGFARATGPGTVSVAGGVPAHDPLAGAITPAGTPVGTLALDPRTRRRMRLNGTARPSRRGFTVEAEQVFQLPQVPPEEGVVRLRARGPRNRHRPRRALTPPRRPASGRRTPSSWPPPPPTAPTRATGAATPASSGSTGPAS